MKHIPIEARSRSVIGKKVKTLRRHGVLPANVYGHNVPSQAIQLDAHDFNRAQRHLSASSIVDLIVDGGAARPAMIHRTQRSVRNGLPTHVEFFQVNMAEPVTANVPLVLAGEPAALKHDPSAMVLQEMDTIEVTCLPGDLPGLIEVNVEGLSEVGAAIHVRDLVYDGAKIHVRSNPDDLVVAIVGAQKQVEEELAAEAAAEAEPAAEAVEATEKQATGEETA